MAIMLTCVDAGGNGPDYLIKLPVASSCSHAIQGIVAINEAYYRASAPITGTQIRKAGERLARVLNEALK